MNMLVYSESTVTNRRSCLSTFYSVYYQLVMPWLLYGCLSSLISPPTPSIALVTTWITFFIPVHLYYMVTQSVSYCPVPQEKHMLGVTK